MCLKCRIKSNIIEIEYKSKTYYINRDKLNHVLNFLDKIKDSAKDTNFSSEKEIIEKLDELGLIDEYFFRNINNI